MASFCFIVDSSVVGYESEPPAKRGIAWPRWTGFRGMTLRSWLELLVVPLALVVIGLVFTMMQDTRQQALENRRADAERELAERRAQDEALQAYLNQMSQLILDRKLLEAEQGTPLYTVAQARTSTVILRLDSEHNESVTRFLINSGLAKSSEASARLLREITLSHAKLSGAHLPNADLSDADLMEADLRGANLRGAHLSHAHLSHAHLRWAYLQNADLSGAYLSEAHLRYTNLNNIDLSGAHLSHAYLNNTDLSGANLSHANLSRATLDCLNLESRANLSYANLNNLRGCTKEELRSAFTLKGATMPNGQKYEEWLKSKDQKENKKSDGSS